MIKHVVFDLGGVIERVYPEKVIDSFKTIGVLNYKEIFSLNSQLHICDQFETGKITFKDFFDSIKKLSTGDINIYDVKSAWCSNQGGVSKNTETYLKKLKEKCHISLLSNTNETHYKYILESYKKKFGYEFESLFESIILSYKAGIRKPSPQIFKRSFNATEEHYSKILYVDDLKKNCDAAKRLGVESLHHQTNRSIDLGKFF